MYADHQPMIAKWAACSPTRTAHVAKFVLASIRCKFEYVPRRLQNVLDGNDHALIAAARDGFRYVDTIDLRRGTADMTETELLMHYTQIPGIGIVKSGFIVQLLHGLTGCLDIRNVRMYGLDTTVFAMPAKAALLRERCTIYADLCRTLGGSERLWNQWCQDVARARPTKWINAEHVSASHVDCVLNTYRG